MREQMGPWYWAHRQATWCQIGHRQRKGWYWCAGYWGAWGKAVSRFNQYYSHSSLSPFCASVLAILSHWLPFSFGAWDESKTCWLFCMSVLSVLEKAAKSQLLSGMMLLPPHLEKVDMWIEVNNWGFLDIWELWVESWLTGELAKRDWQEDEP